MLEPRKLICEGEYYSMRVMIDERAREMQRRDCESEIWKRERDCSTDNEEIKEPDTCTKRARPKLIYVAIDDSIPVKRWTWMNNVL